MQYIIKDVYLDFCQFAKLKFSSSPLVSLLHVYCYCIVVLSNLWGKAAFELHTAEFSLWCTVLTVNGIAL